MTERKRFADGTSVPIEKSKAEGSEVMRRKKLPERRWAVVQCEDGIEYLIPYDMIGDTDLNCPTLPVEECVKAYRAAQKKGGSDGD